MQSTKIGKYKVWYENSEEFNELRREIWSHHAYYLEDLEEPMKVVDIGAHIGLATLYFAQMYPEAKIAAYEPDPQSYELLIRNVSENGLTERIRCIKAAVAPKSGKLKLQAPIYPDEWRSGVGIIPKGWRSVLHTKEMEVEAVGIREILEEGADLVKMDIEGMEYEVVTNGEWSKVKNMIMEVHPREGKRIFEIEKYLIDQKYEIEKRMDESKYGEGLCTIVAHRV